MPIQISSDAFRSDERIPVSYTGDGPDLSPPLRWGNLPPGTKELALIVSDPDAPRPEPFVHWVIYKIPPDLQGLPEGLEKKPKPGQLPEVMQGTNSFKNVGYNGPAPPSRHGTHHYHFRLLALDKPLEVQPGLDEKALIASMSGHILDDGELVGTYERA